jgi:hypothetical protein
MAAMPMWYVAILYAHHFLTLALPRRYAIPGKTKIRYRRSISADARLNDRRDILQKSDVSLGTVVGYSYEYVGPWNNNRRPMGCYAWHAKFPWGYIVLSGDGKQLLCVSEENARFVSGYRYTIPWFGIKRGSDSFRVKDLPRELRFFPGDAVQREGDETVRRIGRIFFTPVGDPEYELLMTAEEIEAENLRRRQEAEKKGRAWAHCDGGTYAWTLDRSLTLKDRGNLFYLHHGMSEKMSFATVEDEVRFFSQEAGEWMHDSFPQLEHHLHLSVSEALTAIDAGEIDMAVGYSLESLSPIKILPHFGACRERARAAGRSYLESLS